MLPTYSPFLSQTGIVFAYQFNATKHFLGLKRKKSINPLRNFTDKWSPFFAPSNTSTKENLSPCLREQMCRTSLMWGLFVQAVSKYLGKELGLQIMYFLLLIKLLQMRQMTSSGSMTLSTVLPLVIDCANNLQRLNLCLLLHISSWGVIPILCFWAFSAMAHSLFLIVLYEDTFFVWWKKKTKTTTKPKHMYGKTNRIERLWSPLRSA